MPLSAIQAYLKQLPKRQAEIRLMMAEAASAPHLAEDDRKQWTDELLDQIEGERVKKARVVPAAILAIKTGISVRVKARDT